MSRNQSEIMVVSEALKETCLSLRSTLCVSWWSATVSCSGICRHTTDQVWVSHTHTHTCTHTHIYIYSGMALEWLVLIRVDICFTYRWLKGYIYSSCYHHHQIGSIHLSHCFHIFPWLCAWDFCYIIFCHLLHIHSGKTGNLFSLVFIISLLLVYDECK